MIFADPLINPETVSIPDALLISLIAIMIVFGALIFIIAITALIELATTTVLSKTSIMPRKENKILEEDKDAVVAVLVAAIDFHKETGKEARVNSITRWEED